MDPLDVLLSLRYQYRQAQAQFNKPSATADEIREAGGRMAVILSELQHPQLLKAAQDLAEGRV